MDPVCPDYGPEDARRDETFAQLKECWHGEIAVAAGLFYCVKYKWQPPDWLIARAAKMAFASINGHRSARLGISPKAWSRFERDMIHLDRFSAVSEVREKQKILRAQVRELKRHRGVRGDVLREREKMLSWAGKSWLRAYQCAALLLQGTKSFAKEDAIGKSYKKVKGSENNRVAASRYYLFEPDVLSKLGIRLRFTGASAAERFVPLYERQL
jgi:hypothetical protein